MRRICVVIVMLLISSNARCEVSHDVLLEKLTNINTQITDLKTLMEKRDSEISDLKVSQSKINKETDDKINNLLLVQGEQAIKINIIWGVLGVAAGGGGALGGTRLYKRTKNGKAEA